MSGEGVMGLRLGRLVILVRDYDEALRFYVGVLGCEVLVDVPGPGHRRFVHLRFPKDPDQRDAVGLWLLKPEAPQGLDRVGRQTGGEPVAVLYTDDFDAAVERWRRSEVRFAVDPYEEPGAKIAHIVDLYGNEFVVVELAADWHSP